MYFEFILQTEQIRRANRLWATDSLFLREHLMVPVPADSPFSPIEQPNAAVLSKPLSVEGASTPTEGEKSIHEFLGEIDSSIANTKNEVKKSQGNSE